MYRRTRIVAAAFAATIGLTGATPLRSASPTFRIEAHTVATVDLTTAQILTGEAQGPARTIAGELRLPVTSEVKVPAVILLHGDGGQLSNQVGWTDTLNGLGIAVFALDSYSGRGAISNATRIGPMEGAEKIGSLLRTVDAHRALAVLARHPRIDATRIALMGFSGGGRAVLNASTTRFSEPYAMPGGRFAAFIALYPPCNVTLIDDDAVHAAPVRIYHGAEDVITRGKPCRDYAERLRRAGRDITYVEFADAHHGFDNPSGGPLLRSPQVPNTSGCSFEERPRGALVNAHTGKPLAMDDACVTRGLIGGSNPKADAAVKEAVGTFLRRVFRLPVR